MPEPNEPLKGLTIPNTGDLVGAWGTAALNANFQAIGGMFGGTLSLSLSGATTITLTAPSGSITPGGGPTQQQNRILKFTGVQTGNAVVIFSLPGDYIIDNQCTGTTSLFLQLQPSNGTGNNIGVPRGKKTSVCFDGTHMDFINPADPGTAYDLHGATVLPGWMNACTIAPYLIKDGTSYSTASYTALFQAIGTTFGGAGGSFNVPDELSRMRLPVDTKSVNRVTAGGSGIAGTTMGAAGGNELMQSHQHANTVSEVAHNHGISNNFLVNGGIGFLSGGPGVGYGVVSATNNATASVSITNATTGSGGSQNMPPTIVSFLALIKT